VLHLHGELKKSRSTIDDSIIYPIDGWELKWGDQCEKGSQLRPHIVWFGEPVPMIAEASRLTMEANIFIIIGTSLNVYPAAGLVHYVKPHIKKYLVDPNDCKSEGISNLTIIKEKAGTGVPAMVEKLLNEGL
jgi:NAD-dependent deacetylase